MGIDYEALYWQQIAAAGRYGRQGYETVVKWPMGKRLKFLTALDKLVAAEHKANPLGGDGMFED